MSEQQIFQEKPKSEEGNWISISDLMSGLMVLFLFIAITFIRSALEREVDLEKSEADFEKIVSAWEKSKADIENIVLTWEKSKSEIYKRLDEEFKYDLKRWNAEIIEETLTVRFRSPEVLFDSAKSTLKPRFKSILDDFFPRFIRILSEFRHEIDEIRIEGHTSSEWEGSRNEDDAYIKNMELSQDRTRSVLEYVYLLGKVKRQRAWMKLHLTANGLSSSKLQRLRNGREDRKRSRRVDFRIRTKTEEKIEIIIERLN